MSQNTEAAIWMRIIHPNGKLSPSAARALLKLEFTTRDRKRMHELAMKVQAGPLTSEEQYEIDSFDRVGTLLAILKSKARKVLKRAAVRQRTP